MTLRGLEYWVLAQVGLEIVLVGLLLFFLMKFRSLGKILKNSREEGQANAEDFQKMLEKLAVLEKRQAALEESLGSLNGKARSVSEQNPPMRPSPLSAQPRGASLRLQVEDLHLKGFSAGEIAQRLGLHPTEVKMALDLARLKAD